VEFQITEKLLSEKRAILTLSGQLNAVTAPDLKAQLKRLVKGGHIQIISDLTLKFRSKIGGLYSPVASASPRILLKNRGATLGQ